MSLRKKTFSIFCLCVLAMHCSGAQAVDHAMTGEAGGMGGAGGAGGNEGAAGSAGGEGIAGGAGGAGGAQTQRGADGASGATSANANGGAAGSGGRGGDTNSLSTTLAGGGGGGGGGGKGGAGERHASADDALEAITLQGGAGGMGGAGGAGGDSLGGNSQGAGSGGGGGDGGGGGGVALIADRAIRAEGLSLIGGAGGTAAQGGAGGLDNGNGHAGNGGQGGSGGQGGDALLTLRAARALGDVTLIGGNGGDGSDGGAGQASGGGTDHGGDGGNAGAAGKGGQATLSLEAQAVTTGNIAITSGAQGAAGNAGHTPSGTNPPYDGKGGQGSVGGAGGAANFSARRLAAPSLYLVRQDGALNFNIETLDVRAGNTTVILEHTRADEVDFGKIHLGSGQTLDMRRAAPTAYRFATLEVEGSHAAYIEGDMLLSGRALVFTPSPTLTEGATLLHVSGAIDVDQATVGLPDLIGLQGGHSQRDTLSLLQAGSLSGTPQNEGMRVKGLQGVSILYDYALKTDPQQGGMRLEAISSQAAPQSKALSEGFLSGLVLLNQGGNLAANDGMLAALERGRRQTGRHLFVAFSGGHLRQESGSHIELDSVALITGISAETRLAKGRLTSGVFVEYGRGDYESENHFGAADQHLSLSGARHVRGQGDGRYTGGGALIHYAADDGYYAETSLRAGRLKVRFTSNDLRDYLGRRAQYGLATPYYGAHVGAGRSLVLGKGSVDIYGKYFWLRQQGEHVLLSTGDDLRFANSQSERLRAGLRINQPLASIWKSYVGLAYEHESNGKSRAATRTHSRSYAIDAPELKGNSGMFEIGLSAQQGKGIPLSLDLGLQAYTDRSEGVIGSIHVDWVF